MRHERSDLLREVTTVRCIFAELVGRIGKYSKSSLYQNQKSSHQPNAVSGYGQVRTKRSPVATFGWNTL
jgi:hypothetical protein